MRFFNAHSLRQALTRKRVFHVAITLRAGTLAIIVGLILLGLVALTLWAGAARLPSIRGASDAMDLSSLTPLGPGLERYFDPVSGFFFDYPETLSLSETDDNGSHVIFGDTADGETRLLVVSTPNALQQPLTEELIRAQYSAVEITSGIDSMRLPSGVTAFLFRRSRTPLGTTRDALFTHGVTLYQISVAEDHEHIFNRILESWRFGDRY
jgi:hypothetical protein